MSTASNNVKDSMDRMYRFTRHIYDATRKYYLLGRDILIRRMKPKAGEHICEVGCGTARNLRKLAKRYPDAHFYGIDASEQMLITADKALKKAGVRKQVRTAQGLSQSFDPQSLFTLSKPLDKIIFSYALSIIPPWKASIDHALDILPSGGEIHIVDFGGQEGFPGWFRAFLFWWLRMFHVYHKPEILNYLKQLKADKRGSLRTLPVYKGYAYYAVFKKK